MASLSARGRAALATGAAAALLAGALSACSSSGSGSDSSPSSSGSAGAGRSAAGDPHTANVTITAADGCVSDRTSFNAGAINFKIANKDATAVSEVEFLSGERIVGEKENLPPGFSGTFSVSVDAGDYVLYCPGAKVENTPVKVTGQAASTADDTTSALLATGVKQYAAYVTNQVGYLVTSTTNLQNAIASGNLEKAQAAYMTARPYYEKIEPVAESFTVGKDNLDADIDARAGDVPAKDWTGFHPIEKALFQQKTTAGLTSLAAGLVANSKKLQTLTTGLTYKPFELANGAQDLLDEVASSKITGEEERYYHIDLLDFQANDEGAEQAFACLQPALQKIDPSLTQEIGQQFVALNALVDKYRTGANPSGFELYTALTSADKKALASAVKAVQEPLSQVASKVANA